MYDAEKIYYGIVKTYYSEKESGFIINSQFGAVGFHIRQFISIRNSIEIREVLKFNLINSKKKPDSLRANNIEIVEVSILREVIKLQRINNDERFSTLILLLEKEKGTENYAIVSSLAYEMSSALYKLKLWINKYVTQFDFNLFQKYYFRLNRQEALEFKKFVKLNIHASKVEDLRRLGKSKINQNEGGQIILETSWHNIGFEDGRIYINTGDSQNTLITYPWQFAKDHFNLLVTGYITKRDLGSIFTEVLNNKIVSITGLENLQEAILIAEVSKARKKIDEIIEEGIKPKQIRFHPEFVNLGNADLLRIFGNHVCIDYLQKIQSTSLDMPVIYIQERIFLTTGISKENSYLFSVILPDEMVSIIWESVKLDRATQIFCCSMRDYVKTITNIENFLTSDTIKKRSQLKSVNRDNILLQNNLCYVASVQHTQYNFEKWRRNLHFAIPNLPRPLEGE